MNKSLSFRIKLYRFCFLLISFFLFINILYVFFYGNRGLISYYKLSNKSDLMEEHLVSLEKYNILLEDKIERLNPNTLDLDFLDEQLRLQTGKFNKNEIIIDLK